MLLVNISTIKDGHPRDHIFSATTVTVTECSDNGVPIAIEILSQEPQGCWNRVSYDLPAPAQKSVYVMNSEGKTFQSYHFHEADSNGDSEYYVKSQVTCSECGFSWEAQYSVYDGILGCPGCQNTVNTYGVRVSHHVCEDCGRPFSLTPASTTFGNKCLADDCASYDPERDTELRLKEESPEA